MTEMTMSGPERMKCMEIIGGNQAIDRSFRAVGLDLYVHSQPFEQSEQGGDIYFLTSCASGRLSRFLLADVSGHGNAASGVATSLRDLMRDNVNRVSQAKFVEKMNHQFSSLVNNSCFATAVVATYFEPTKVLSISVAGHPYPLYYRARLNRWFHLDPAQGDRQYENMPLGVVDETTYPERRIDTEVGDMFLLYTDAFIESAIGVNENELLGIQGVLEILNGQPEREPDEVIPFLREHVGSMASGNLTNDDASLLLGSFTNTKATVRDSLLAPMRLLGEACDRSEIKTW